MARENIGIEVKQALKMLHNMCDDANTSLIEIISGELILTKAINRAIFQVYYGEKSRIIKYGVKFMDILQQ